MKLKNKPSTSKMAKSKPKKAQEKVKTSEKLLDDFMANWSDSEDDDDIDEDKVSGENSSKATNGAKNGHHKILTKNEDSEDSDESSGEEDNEIDGDSQGSSDLDSALEEEEGGDEAGDEEPEGDDHDTDNEESGTGASQQKRYIASLKDKDPEFFEFLKENDEELLQFDESSSEDDSEAEDSLHKPPETLEVASDESDFEDVDVTAKKTNIVSKSMLDKWEEELSSKPTVTVVADVISAFRSAVSTVATEESAPTTDKGKKGKTPKPEAKPVSGRYVVEGSAAFNGVVRLCLTNLGPACAKVLNLGAESSRKASQPKKSKNWPKLNKHLKMYTADVVKLMTSLTNGSVLGAMLKHVQNVVPYFVAIPKSLKSLMKCLVNFWSTGSEETVRVLSFMCLIRLTRISIEVRGEDQLDEGGDSASVLETVLKQMYMAFVRNVKFTSPSSWPMIHFMRRSLAEIFNLDHQVAYRYAFIYIRQLAIHLRNAMMQKEGKEGALETVYNWQFVHCTHLWTQLLSESFPSDVLEPLIYPLVQVITGAIRLVYTPKFYPLRFHLCSQLVQITGSTRKFIPVLPYYLDILNKYNFSKKTSKLSMKPLDFSCCLRVSKSELAENGFKDTTIDQIYCGLLDYLHSVSHKISFPELVVPLTFQLKAFLKKCKVGNYCKKLKQVLDKTIENGKFIVERRRKVTFGIKDLDQIQAWEEGVRVEGTPLSKFYTSFRKVKEQETLKKISRNENLDDYDFVPKMTKKSKSNKIEAFNGIFGQDESEDDEDDSERFELKEDRKKSKKEKRRRSSEESEDEPPQKVPKNKKADKKVPKRVAEDLPDDEDVQDEVEDLNVDELGSEDDDDQPEESLSASDDDVENGDHDVDDSDEESSDDDE